MWVSLFFSLYVFSSLYISFCGYPLISCFFLLLGSVSLCIVVYTQIGFSWLLMIFCLVYIGGVFILFLFVCVCNPNNGMYNSESWVLILVCSLASTVSCVYCSSVGGEFEERSLYFSSSINVYSYLSLSLLVCLGMVILSWVFSSKEGFFR